MQKKPKNLSVNNFPLFEKGGEGGFFQGIPRQIPLDPPFPKGDLKGIAYLRISSKNKKAGPPTSVSYPALLSDFGSVASMGKISAHSGLDN